MGRIQGVTQKKAKPRGLSNTAAASHFGVSRQTMAVWENNGWVVRYKDRSIDVKATEVRVDDKRDKGKARSVLPGAKVDHGVPAESMTPDEAQAALDERRGVPEGVTMDAARLSKEHWTAEKVRLQVRQAEGELIDIMSARKAYSSVITAARVALEAVPARTAPQVVGLDSMLDVRRVIQREISTALRSLVDEAPQID